jgi:hypothetical protein
MTTFSLRYLLIDADDKIFRLPLARFERMLSASNQEALPQWADQRMRGVELTIQMENRKPLGIYRSLFYYFHFDSDGKLLRAALYSDTSKAIGNNADGLSTKNACRNIMRSAIDRDQYVKDGVTVMEAGEPIFSSRIRDPKIINAERQFAIRRRDHSVWWKPSPQLEEEISKIGLGKRKCRSI